jgi:hypothetical protein
MATEGGVFEHDPATFCVITFEPETASTIALKMLLVARVPMNESTRIMITTTTLRAPHTRAMARPAASASQGLALTCARNHAVVIPVRPMTDPAERSYTPADSGITSPSATRTVIEYSFRTCLTVA